LQAFLFPSSEISIIVRHSDPRPELSTAPRRLRAASSSLEPILGAFAVLFPCGRALLP